MSRNFFCKPCSWEGFASVAVQHIVTELGGYTGQLCPSAMLSIWNYKRAAEKHSLLVWLLSHSWRVMAKCNQAAVRFPCAQSQVTAELLWSGGHSLHGCPAVCQNGFWTRAGLCCPWRGMQTPSWYHQYLLQSLTSLLPIQMWKGHSVLPSESWLLNTCHLKLVFPGSQPYLTAFWFPSSLPERRGSQQWSHLLPWKLQCYSKESSPKRSSIPRLGPRTARFQRLILFVKWSVTKKQNILSDTAKNKVGQS